MQLVTGRFAEAFCKNTMYRFLSAAKTNWERFVLQLSERIINRTIRPLTEKDRKDVFIVDDSLLHLQVSCTTSFYGALTIQGPINQQ